MLNIKKGITLSLVAVSAFTLIGCSSYPETQEEVAKSMCKAFKSGDMDAVLSYMSPEKVKSISEDEMTKAKEELASEKFIEEAKKINCDSVTYKKSYDKYTKFEFEGFPGRLKVSNTKVDDKYFVTNF